MKRGVDGPPLAEAVERLRRVLDDVKMQTRPGDPFFERFHDDYHRLARAGEMRTDAEWAALIREVVVEPLVRRLRRGR